MMSAPNDPRRCELRMRDAAAYVLGALPEHEFESYREHLRDCPECAAEILALQPAADSLALGVVRVQAPPELRARLMAVVGGEAELLRAAGHEADLPPRRRAGWRARLAPALGAASALAAGLLIGALAIGGGTGAVTRTQTIEAAVTTPGYRATAALQKSGSHVVLVLNGMPAPPPGRIYEIWLERGSQAPQPTDALFSVTHSGGGSVGVPGSLEGVSKVLVTAEPLGGSLKPTREPVIVASV
jgi:anti-sigma-K factor RskA